MTEYRECVQCGVESRNGEDICDACFELDDGDLANQIGSALYQTKDMRKLQGCSDRISAVRGAEYYSERYRALRLEPLVLQSICGYPDPRRCDLELWAVESDFGPWLPDASWWPHELIQAVYDFEAEHGCEPAHIHVRQSLMQSIVDDFQAEGSSWRQARHEDYPTILGIPLYVVPDPITMVSHSFVVDLEER